MFPAPFEYVSAHSLDEALEVLESRAGEAKVLAGGQSLIPMMRFRLAQPQVLVDINPIKLLEDLHEQDDALHIGALARHATLEFSPLIQQRYPLIADVSRVVADPTVRNLGTLVGSLCHADPAGDFGSAALAAGAEVIITSSRQHRSLPVDAFFLDTFSTALEEDEIVTEVRWPKPKPRSAGAYLKIERKVGDFAIVGTAVQMALDEGGRIAEAGIGLCAVGPISLRAKQAERLLVGQSPSAELFQEVARQAARESDPTSDTRGSKEYKQDMVRVLTLRALQRAYQRIQAA
ncbi:MAG: xanthine dehydrogenase family protein subunit M [Firmicutes bacterium]|nr:xanthine dehydrogenase family protein subunit M [Bacillota bacterium]